MEPGSDRRGTTPLLPRDCGLRRLSRVQSICGGTTEIQKEIIARDLGL
jgi:alkylation response protein AidB-like acyl-CoA dehydrogenase